MSRAKVRGLSWLEAYGQAATVGQTEQAEAAALPMLCLTSEEAERNPSPELLLAAQPRACEERRV